MRQLLLSIILVLTCSAWAQYSGNIEVTSAQATFLGENAGDLAGHHVAIVPDLNNDGYDELLVSAPLWDVSDQSTNHGRVYLFYGKSQGWSGTLNLADADARLYGTYALNEAAHDAFGIGDIDGDGYSDLAIAIKKTQAPQGGTRLGKVYIFFGKSGKLSGDLSLEDADASLVGNAAGAEASHVMGVGDLDRDGYDDFIVGAGFYPQVGAEAGKVYVFFGKPRAQWAKNVNMETASDASFLAENAGDWAGHRVSGLGDVNGDGFADFLVGANHRNAGDVTLAGAVYLILGKPRTQWGKDISLSQADASWLGDTAKQNLGWNVARVGDVDGDGLDDILFANNASTYYLILAKNLVFVKNVPIGTAGAAIFSHGTKVNDGIGHDIAGVGDLNFDGYDDFLIGNSPVNDPVKGTAVGKSYLFMGRAQWPSSVAMTSADAVFIGAATNDESGFSVSGGDVNGDGVNDLLISAYKNDRAATDAGAAYLFLTPLNRLTLLFPNGGETLVGGQTATIRWTPDPTVDFVTLELSTDNGGSWQPIVENIADGGAHPWTIPLVSSNRCLVRVKDAADGDPADISNEPFTITTDVRLTLIAPNGGENIASGSTFPIRWSSLNLIGKVKIEYSIDGGVTFDLVAETENTGSYNWLVPDRKTTVGLVRISAAAAKQPTDQSDRPFTITGSEYEITRIEAEDAMLSAGYVVEEREETSGGKIARLTSGHAMGEITFLSTLPIDEYQIFIRYLDENDGVSSSILQINGVPVKSWPWNAVEQSDTWVYFFAGRKKINPGDVIKLQNQRDNGEYCRIDYLEFRRTPPPPAGISVLSPNGGERWSAGSRRAVRWTSTGTSGQVDIELTRDNGGQWELLADDAPDNGVFDWLVTPPASEQCLIRITDSDGSPSDRSDATFAVELPPTPKVTVTSPNGGERWQIGASYAVTWTSEHTGSTVAVHLSRDRGATWQTLAATTANSGSFAWTAAAPASDSCLVKVTDVASGAADSSDAVFTLYEQPHQTIAVVRPNGGELWEIGTLQEIAWTSQYVTGNVRIELSRDDGVNWTSLTDDALNSGSLNWQVFGPASSRCRMRITAKESGVSDISDSAFEIVPPPSLTLTSPNGGELWLIGTVKEITWATQRTDGPAKLELSRNGGDSWQTITDSTENDGAFGWTVNGPASDRCLVRVSAGALSDVSDGLFEIKAPQQPQVTLTSPNGGETWEIGFPREIRWASQLVTGPVKIEVSRNNGATFQLIEASTENDGNHLWAVEGPASTACRIRITATDGSAADVSDAPFSIVETPKLTILAPNGGENWRIGDGVVITWSSVSTGGAVKIQLSRDNGASWTTLADSTLDDGAFEWTVEGPASTTCLLLILDVDGFPIDISDSIFTIEAPTGVRRSAVNPGEFALRQNFPNPFNPETSIEYQLPRDAQVNLTIFSLQGTRVRTLVSGFQSAGAYSATWNGRDEDGRPVPSGLYFYRLTADGFQETHRMLLAK